MGASITLMRVLCFNPMETPYGFVMDCLAQTKGKWPLVAAGSGVSKRTIEKYASGAIKNPGGHNLDRLFLYFKRKQ